MPRHIFRPGNGNFCKECGAMKNDPIHAELPKRKKINMMTPEEKPLPLSQLLGMIGKALDIMAKNEETPTLLSLSELVRKGTKLNLSESLSIIKKLHEVTSPFIKDLPETPSPKLQEELDLNIHEMVENEKEMASVTTPVRMKPIVPLPNWHEFLPNASLPDNVVCLICRKSRQNSIHRNPGNTDE